MRTVLIACVVTALAAGCAFEHHEWWHRAAGGVLRDQQRLADTTGELVGTLGKPHRVMPLSAFVDSLRDSAAGGNSFPTYRARILGQMTHQATMLRIECDDWYAREPYGTCAVWIYDEAERYRAPFLSTWCAAIFVIDGDRVVDRFWLFDWDPNGLDLPKPSDAAVAQW
jgi:hypothetical protein